MTTYDPTRPVYGPAIGTRLFAAATATVGAFQIWNDRRMTRKSLGRLTDRELDDIGLVRADLERM